MPYKPSMPMRRRAGSFTARLDQPRFPGRGHQRRIDLDRQVIGERLGAVRADPVDHALQALAQTDFALIAKQLARLIRRAGRVLHFARTRRDVDRFQIEIEKLGQNAGELVNRNRFLVGADVDHFAGQPRQRSHLYQRIDAVLHEGEAARLLTVAVNDRLLSLQHAVYHDAGDVSESVVIFLLWPDDVVGDSNDILDSMGVADVRHQQL